MRKSSEMLLAPNDLPINWKSVSMRQVLETIESGKRPKGGVRNISDGVPSVGGEHLTWDGGFDFSETRYVPMSFFESVQKGKVRVGDVLVVKDGATTGKTAFVDHTFPFSTAAVNEHVFVLRSRSDVCLEKFLFYALYSPLGQTQIKQSFHGAAQGGINQQFVDEVMIPLPPLSEQRRIVAKIEALFDRIREAKRLRAEALEEARTLVAASLREVFKAVWGRNEKVALGKLSTRITKGESPKWQGFDYVEKGPLFIRSENVLWGDLDLSTVGKIPQEFHQKLKRSQLRSGDVLVNLVGASIGRACVVPDSIGVANVNQAVGVISPISEAVVARFLMYFVISPIGQEIIHGGKVEAARANISLGDLKGLPVPMPQISDQRRIAAYLDGVAETVRTMKERHEATDAELKRLEQSILDRAFRGEL